MLWVAGRVAARDVSNVWEHLTQLRERMQPGERGDKEKMTYGELQDLLQIPEIVSTFDYYMGFHGMVEKGNDDSHNTKEGGSPEGSPKSKARRASIGTLKDTFKHDIQKVTRAIHDQHQAERNDMHAKESAHMKAERERLEAHKQKSEMSEIACVIANEDWRPKPDDESSIEVNKRMGSWVQKGAARAKGGGASPH